MSGKAGELIPTYRKNIHPSAPYTRTQHKKEPRIARIPNPEGLAEMKKCKEIVYRMREESKARYPFKEEVSSGSLRKTFIKYTHYLIPFFGKDLNPDEFAHKKVKKKETGKNNEASNVS